jgi:hypothetical protein
MIGPGTVQAGGVDLTVRVDQAGYGPAAVLLPRR